MKSHSSISLLRPETNSLAQQTLITKVSLDEMEPVLDEQHKLHQFVNNLETNLQNLKIQQELFLKNKHIRILSKLEDTKKKIKYFETGLCNIDEILDENGEMQYMKSHLEDIEKWLALLSKIYSELLKKIETMKHKIILGKKIIQQKKTKLNTISHENIVLSANIIKTRKIIGEFPLKKQKQLNMMINDISAYRKSLNSIDDCEEASTGGIFKSQTHRPAYLPSIGSKIGLPIGFSTKSTRVPTSPTTDRNLNMSPILKYPDQMKNQESMRYYNIEVISSQRRELLDMPINNNNTTTPTSTITTATKGLRVFHYKKNEHDKNQVNELGIPINSGNLNQIDASANQLDNMVNQTEMLGNLTKELKAWQGKNQGLRTKISQNISIYCLFFQLFEDCYNMFYKQLSLTEKKSKKGLKGSLLFELLENNSKGKLMNRSNSFSQITPKGLTKKKISEIPTNSEYESIRVMYRTLKQIASSDFKRRIKKEEMPLTVMNQEYFMNLYPIQVMGMILLKPEIFEDVYYEFEDKKRQINLINESIKQVNKIMNK